MKNRDARYRTQLALAATGAAATVAALMFRACEPLPEPARKFIPGVDPLACRPQKGDMECEAGKGEADPASKNFDAESCGYCGDGIRQRQTSRPKGSEPYLDGKARGEIWLQDVTGRPSETPSSCPVDFHCGNKKPDFRATYGAWLKPEPGKPGAKWALGTKTITESWLSCPPDLQGAGSASEEEEHGDDAVPENRRQSWSCPSYLAPSGSGDMVDMHSSSVWSVLSRIHEAVSDHAGPLRGELGAAPDDKLDLTFRIHVNAEGKISLRSVSANCAGEPCGGGQQIVNAIDLTLRGLIMDAPGTDCYWTLDVRVPNAL